jgi:hypothetical protein
MRTGVAVIALDELKIPKGLRSMVDEIVGITDLVCLSVLDEECADLARRAVAKLARKRPSPLRAAVGPWPSEHVGSPSRLPWLSPRG